MNPFDLEKALAGHPVVTRDGQKIVEIHCFKNGNDPVAAILEGNECLFYKKNGRYLHYEETEYDLFMATTKKTYYQNLYRYDNGTYGTGCLYETREMAEKQSQDIPSGIIKLVKTIEIEIEE